MFSFIAILFSTDSSIFYFGYILLVTCTLSVYEVQFSIYDNKFIRIYHLIGTSSSNKTHYIFTLYNKCYILYSLRLHAMTNNTRSVFTPIFMCGDIPRCLM